MKILLVVICLILQLSWSLPALASEFKVATWNIAHLNDENGEGEKQRSDEDFNKLAEIALELDADIIAVQEVENAEAVKRVFGSDYQFEISKREIPANRFQQRTGFAIRQGIEVTRNPDYEDLATSSGLRYGTDVTVELEGKKLRLLSVHLKSGCFTQDLDNPSSDSCQKLSQQIPKLEEWIDRRANEGIPYIVLGDFNRRMNDSDELWTELDDGIPANADLERVPSQGAEPACWKFREYIDFFLMSPQVARWRTDGLISIRIPEDTSSSRDTKLSDHCPLAILLEPELNGAEPDVIINQGVVIRCIKSRFSRAQNLSRARKF